MITVKTYFIIRINTWTHNYTYLSVSINNNNSFTNCNSKLFVPFVSINHSEN